MHGAADFGIDLGWLPELGRTQAIHGRAAAYDDTGRCAYHLSPPGCTLLDGENGDGTGLIERYGRKSKLASNGAPVVRKGSPTEPTDPQPSAALAASEPSAEVRKRSADLMTWCQRFAVGIHFYSAHDHASEHAGEDCNGYYRAKDIAAKSGLCHDCWSTYRPYVDESDEGDVDADTNPERHPNRLRWRSVPETTSLFALLWRTRVIRHAHAVSHVPSDTAGEYATSTPVLVRPRGRAPISESGVREHTPHFRCSSRTTRQFFLMATKAALVGRIRLH